MSIRDVNEPLVSFFSKHERRSKVDRVLTEWIGSSQRVIDIGCGDGFYADFCRGLGNSVVGIDITQQVQSAHNLALDVCQGNVEGDLPFPDATFSLALCIEVVEHLLQPEKMLAEIKRVLKPGGVLIITTPNYAYWALRLLYLFGCLPVGLPSNCFTGLRQRDANYSVPPWRDPHIRFFTPEILRRCLQECGFATQSLRATFVAFPSGLAPHLPFWLGLPLRAIGKLIGNLEFLGDRAPTLLAAGLLVKAVKE
jgi:SAM-dependent methyltransferase